MLPNGLFILSSNYKVIIWYFINYCLGIKGEWPKITRKLIQVGGVSCLLVARGYSLEWFPMLSNIYIYTLQTYTIKSQVYRNIFLYLYAYKT